jgi:hypothetical protein
MLKLKQERKLKKQYELADDLLLLMDSPDLDTTEYESYRLNAETWLDQVLGF